jgi:glycosyltransferase involved in cell wall biosynthesis
MLLKIHSDINARIVPNGVDTEFFKPLDEPTEENSLVFVGGMTWYPNLDAMQYFTREIWHLIKAEVPDLTMNLIGRKPQQNILEFAEQEPGFRPLGFQDDVRPHVHKSAVYVVPIRVGGGTRLKILDAMAMGKAIVSTSIGCEGIDVTDGVDIVIADSARDFATKTIQLLRDRTMRDEIGRNARKKAIERYSWTTIYPELDYVYREVAGKGNQR